MNEIISFLMGLIVILSILFLALFMYFLPTYVAARRERKDKWIIFFLNLFLGWSFAGWLVALIWALMKDHQKQIN